MITVRFKDGRKQSLTEDQFKKVHKALLRQHEHVECISCELHNIADTFYKDVEEIEQKIQVNAKKVTADIQKDIHKEAGYLDNPVIFKRYKIIHLILIGLTATIPLCLLAVSVEAATVATSISTVAFGGYTAFYTMLLESKG